MYHGFGCLSLTYPDPVVCVIPFETILDLSVLFFCSFARLRAFLKNEIPSDNHVMIHVCLLDRPEQTTPLLPSPTTSVLRNDIPECEPHMEYASTIPKLRARSVPSYRSSPPKSTCIVLAEIFTWSSQMKDARARQLSPVAVP